MAVIVRRNETDPSNWDVLDDLGDGGVYIGGPFETRSYARQVAEGARIMARRRAERERGAVEIIEQARGEFRDALKADEAGEYLRDLMRDFIAAADAHLGGGSSG